MEYVEKTGRSWKKKTIKAEYKSHDTSTKDGFVL